MTRTAAGQWLVGSDWLWQAWETTFCGAHNNSGARDLCHKSTVGQNSRHVERKMFKMRELQHQGKVRVGLIPTALNAADLFTKPLPNKVFAEHRATVYNFAAQRDLPRVEGAVFTVIADNESES